MLSLKETRLYKISIFSTPLPCPQMALRCHPIVVKQCKTTAPGTIIMEIDCKILDSYRPDPKTKAIEAKKKKIYSISLSATRRRKLEVDLFEQ